VRQLIEEGRWRWEYACLLIVGGSF